MILHWPLFKAGLVLAGTTTLFLPKTRAGVCEQKRTPDKADLFNVPAPNALDQGFRFNLENGNKKTIEVKEGTHNAGLEQNSDCSINPNATKIYGYAEVGEDPTWPGKTFEVKKAVPSRIEWVNKLTPGSYILTGADNSLGDFSGDSVVDTSLHWAYELLGNTCAGGCVCEDATFETCGVPIVTHLHGGQTDADNDGNPEFFFGPDGATPGVPLIQGPQYVTNGYDYANNLEATSIWYHDHALGITRLNVYAGLAGFYFVRDDLDTGEAGNNLTVPAGDYELAFAIQDRMFKNNGEFLYPAFPGDPAYEGFITCENVELTPDEADPKSPFQHCAVVPNADCDPDIPGNETTGGNTCGPTALAEFFGDHMVVNGKVWPFYNVEPRNYRLRLLNGCDSRFLGVQFCKAASLTDTECEDDERIPFLVIGGDQGLASNATEVQTLLMETGSRYDVIIDFADYGGKRIIMKNVGGDEPFGGDLDLTSTSLTSRIMAFNVNTSVSVEDDFDLATLNSQLSINSLPSDKEVSRVRKVALFEGTDEYGRLQPLLGTAEPATNYKNVAIDWPDGDAYNSSNANLTGQMEGTMTWHEPITENPKFQATEVWEIFNLSGDAHPIHLHLVKFEVINRQKINWDSNTTEDDRVTDNPDGNGLYLKDQKTVQFNGELGDGFKVEFPVNSTDYYDGEPFILVEPYVENHSKDIVTALPGQVTRIKVTFTKKGRYVWHCHILSHEDHEMMRVMFVGDPKTIKRNLRGADCEQVGEA